MGSSSTGPQPPVPPWSGQLRSAACSSSGSDRTIQNHTTPPSPSPLVTPQLPDLLLSLYGTYIRVKLTCPMTFVSLLAHGLPESRDPALLTTMKGLVTQSCLTLSDPVDCSPPGSSVHGILQARILEWVAMPFSRGSSQSGDRTHVSFIADSAPSEPPGKPVHHYIRAVRPGRFFK